MEETEERATKIPPRRRRRWGDRYDGRRLRSLNPFYQITPYIMRSRVDAQDYFEDRIDIGHVEKWLRRVRDAGLEASAAGGAGGPGGAGGSGGPADAGRPAVTGGPSVTPRPAVGFLHVVMAALVRTISQMPRLNRFVAGQKLYARREIQISLALKKKLHEDSPETTIKLTFQPTDTVWDVAAKINAAVESNKDAAVSNETDNTARLFMLAPGFLVRFLVWVLRTLDFYGMLPRAIHRASPFHTSAFVTDLGSLGVRPIYHHLYDFGTTSLFIAFGVKERAREIDREGKVVERRYVGVKVVNDERICDGHYYARAFKYLGSLFHDPTLLETPPERVVEDVD